MARGDKIDPEKETTPVIPTSAIGRRKLRRMVGMKEKMENAEKSRRREKKNIKKIDNIWENHFLILNYHIISFLH